MPDKNKLDSSKSVDSSELFDAFYIYRDAMGGSGMHGTSFYAHKRTAELNLPPQTEFTNYVIKKAKISRIHKDVGNYKGMVIYIVTDPPEESIRDNALAKLSNEEKEVLGLSNVEDTGGYGGGFDCGFSGLSGVKNLTTARISVGWSVLLGLLNETRVTSVLGMSRRMNLNY